VQIVEIFIFFSKKEVYCYGGGEGPQGHRIKLHKEPIK